MSQKGRSAAGDDKRVVEPITSPSGLDVNPKPPQPRRVSKRAAGAIGVFAFLLLLAFAYGGYKRTRTAQSKVEQAGIPKALAPATSAGNEFVNAIPPGNAAIKPGQQSGQLVALGGAKSDGKAASCGSDPRTHQTYRFDPETGVPCDRQDSDCGTDPRTGQPNRYDPNTGRPCPSNQAGSGERVAIRRAPPSAVPQDDPEKRRLEALARREQEAMQAPTAVRLATSSETTTAPQSGSANPTSYGDLAEVAALGAALRDGRRNSAAPDLGAATYLPASSSSSSAGADYDTQNMQTRKEQFLQSASAKTTNDYLKSIRTAPSPNTR